METEMEFLLEHQPLIALQYNDKNNGVHSLSTSDGGGPIINNESLDAAKYKFENALKLASAVRNLFFFSHITKLKTQKKLRYPVRQVTDVVYKEFVVE